MFCTLGGRSMTISPLSSNSAFNIIPPSATEWVRPTTDTVLGAQKLEAAERAKQNQKKYIKAGIAGSAALVILAAAIAKRNTIAKFFQKLFKNNLTKETREISAAQQKTKIKLPEPKFTAGENNPEQLAKEKAEYIKSIWDEFLDVNPPFKPMNKEKNLLGLKALQNYGTREDMLKLNRRYQLSEDSDIMKEYVKLVGKVGRVDDCLKVLPYATTNSFKTYNEDAMAEIMKTLKKLMVDDSKPNYWINFEYAQYVQIERLTNHPNKIISENAKAITQRLIEDNPWILE